MSSTNQSAFSLDLAGWSQKLKIKAGRLQKKITFDLHGKIMRRTPVKTGRARANWFVTVGAPSKEVNEFTGIKDGTVIPQPTTTLPPIDGTQDAFITNNLKYIKALDEGHSQQAPNGMVKLAIAEELSEMEDAARNL